MVREYARAFNKNTVPCIESAIDIMKEPKLWWAYEKALQEYAEVYACKQLKFQFMIRFKKKINLY